jgi:sirohydrochlorin cobaltochelatase
MNRKAVLLVGHGSPDAEGNDEFLAFVEAVKCAQPPGQSPGAGRLSGRSPLDQPARLEQAGPSHSDGPASPSRYLRLDRAVFHCYIEHARPGMEEGFDQVVAAGADEVVVLPVILFAAGHVKADIPEAIQKASERHPSVRFFYERPLGMDPKVLDVLEGRIQEAGPFPREETAILFVGRGTSDPEANGDFAKLCRLLWERTRFAWVETAFMGVTLPTYEQGLARCLALGAKRIVVLPCFLFTGVLLKRMREILRRCEIEHPDVSFHWARHLGSDPRLAEAVWERTREAQPGRPGRQGLAASRGLSRPAEWDG